ncbi:hypothetical protein [Vibrio harveyi]|uniref:hypothetical protein n=1 Tax=Vibrio harveyi TaxID=669 RepID=UPI003CECB0D2
MNKKNKLQVLALLFVAFASASAHAASFETYDENGNKKECIFSDGENYVYEKVINGGSYSQFTYFLSGRQVSESNLKYFSPGARKSRERTFTLDHTGKIINTVLVSRSFEICYSKSTSHQNNFHHDSRMETASTIDLKNGGSESDFIVVNKKKKCIFNSQNYAYETTSGKFDRYFVRNGKRTKGGLGLTLKYSFGAFVMNDNRGSGATSEEIVNGTAKSKGKFHKICIHSKAR